MGRGCRRPPPGTPWKIGVGEKIMVIHLLPGWVGGVGGPRTGRGDQAPDKEMASLASPPSLRKIMPAG